MHNIDALDKRIMQIIDWKARTPSAKIAKLVRSNKDVVAYRIKKLEDEGIITRYYPILNLSKLGYHINRLNIETEELNASEEKAFVKFLDKGIGSGLVFRMDTKFRYGIFIWTKSVYEMEHILSKIKLHLSSKFVRYRYALMCTVRQYPRDALLGAHVHTKNYNVTPEKLIDHDDLDINILRELAKNARMSTVDIAKKVGAPQPTISYRIRALEKNGVILGYRSDFNVRKLGYQDISIELKFRSFDSVTAIERWADGNPNTTWLQKIIGENDLELELEVKDRDELEMLLNEIRLKFPFIRSIEHYPEDYWKISYLP